MQCKMDTEDLIPYVMLTVAVLLALAVWASASGHNEGSIPRVSLASAAMNMLQNDQEGWRKIRNGFSCTFFRNYSSAGGFAFLG